MEMMEALLEWAKTQDTSCKRKKVVAGLVSEGASDFFCKEVNGSLNECTNVVGNCGCAHAEMKVIIKNFEDMMYEGSTYIYSTYSPCTKCADVIILCGLIKKCFYTIQTEHDMRGIKLLEKAGIECFHLQMEN